MDDVNAFLRDFADAWRSNKATRILVYAVVAAFVVALLASAFADVTRPRIYIVRDGVQEGQG